MKTLECDFLVIGSGAAGLCAAATAAIKGLDVIVAERADVLGGTTAWSGGWMWLPRNALAQAAGIAEDVSEPRRYLESVLGNRFDAERVDAFLEAAPAVVDFLRVNGFEFEAGNSICDIYGDLPGAGTGGRSLIAAPFDGRKLGAGMAMLRRTKRETAFLGMPIQAGADLSAFMNATRNPKAMAHVLKRLGRHIIDIVRFGRATHLVNGVALVARLFELCERHHVRWMLSTQAVELTRSSSRVDGAILEIDGGRRIVKARLGVLLATGGWSQNPALRKQLFPNAADHRSLAVAEADGSAIALARPLGASISTTGAAAGAWCPVSEVVWPDGSQGVFPHIIERGKPGLIAVRDDGKRFVNEAGGYHDFVSAMLAAAPEDQKARAWLICDHRFLQRWGLGIVKPFPVSTSYWKRSGYLKHAPTLSALANICGIDPNLKHSVETYNKGARHGRDDDFGRGHSAYNRYQGDPDRHPNPNVAPLEHGPYYAVEVRPGSFGSFAGLKTNGHAQVLNEAGSEIVGLYAAGADMASIMAGHYPAGGINLGPAMAFGFIAAGHVRRSQKPLEVL